MGIVSKSTETNIHMISIIIPTYNESEFLAGTIRQIFEVLGASKLDGEVILIDDNSPDGTGELAYYLRKFFPNLKTLHRAERLGQVSAILEGLSQVEGNIIGFMDANGHHPPELLPALISPLISGQIDITVASRYVQGGGVSGWPLMRGLLTRWASLLARPITAIKDPLSGYFFVKKSILQGMEFRSTMPVLLLDILGRARFEAVQEIPYIFTELERQRRIVPLGKGLAYLRQVWGLYWKRPMH
jgi:dolichol-phosphate mannosyltransferase